MAPGTGSCVDALLARCAPLSFAPLPELADAAPEGPGWFTAVDAPAHVDAVLAAGSAPRGPHAVHATRAFLRELIFCVAAAAHLVECAPVLDVTGYHFHAGGPDGVDRRVLVARGWTKGTSAHVDAVAAAGLVAVAEPVVAAVRARGGVGPRTLWGYVVDMAHFGMLGLARQLGTDRAAAWDRAEQLAEALYAAGVPRMSKPELVRFGERRDDVWGVRGACCLDFRDRSHGMCITCPVLDPATRHAKWETSALRPA
ncbi:hypothetical protein WEH80_17570 [Actinomycetes bacterium KLBMP 9759]